jgi:hypothetical protein
MRHLGLLCFVMAASPACATAKAAPPPPLFPATSAPETNAEEESEPRKRPQWEDIVAVPQAMPSVRSASPLQDAPAVAGPADEVAEAAPHPPVHAASPRPAAEREMLDIEATLNILVDEVTTAAAELRKLVRQHGGVLIEDVVEEADYASGRFLIRVPAPGTDALMAALERLGQVRNRQVNARDIGKRYRDAELELQNLTVAMNRYEQILGKAEKVPDILAIEHEITRLRGEIEQVKGNLRWMRDRAARSTIHVNLASAHLAAARGHVAPEAKFYPGLRGIFLEDLRGNSVHQGYLGGGVSLRVNRNFSLDIDGLRRTSTGSPTKGLDVLLITMGGEAYSEFLGNGARRFFNPYLGWRMGYARFEDHSEFALGATVGLEVVKTRYVGVDLAVRGVGLLGDSAHLALAPELTLGFAF